MGISVDIQGSEAIATGLGKVLAQTESKVNVAIQRAGLDTQSDAKRDAPYKTGKLRESIKYEPGDLESTVGTELDYAPFVEFGHKTRMARVGKDGEVTISFVKARPFLYPAFEQNARKLEDALKEIIP